jgi:Protein of unknown function (DUF3667)
LQEGINFFGFEKGFLFTIRELLLRPGQTVQDYLTKNRYQYTKPLAFLIATSAIYTFVAHYLKVESVYQDKLEKITLNSGSVNLIHWVQNNYGYTNILSAIFTIYWIRLFFKKQQHNFYEIAVLLFFIMGEGMIIVTLMPINAKYFGSTIFEILINIFSFSYIGWAVGQFFGRRFSNYVKATFAYIFGYFSFMFIATIIAIIYDKFILGK